MFVLKVMLISSAWLLCQCQQPTTTPVPILKQINRQNDDGSYSYGYEAADGSFKIETKYPNGDVAGKYGYIDESGKPREISYGASSKRGFEPQGTGIQVPPPTLNDSPSNALTAGEEDDGQYREDPKIYEDPKFNKGRPSTFRQFHQPAPSQVAQPDPEPRFQYQERQPAYQPSQLRSAPLYSQQTRLFQPQQNIFSQPQQNSFSQPQQSLFNQAPQQFPQQDRPQSQVYHQQPQFSYQAYTPQYNPNYQNYQNQNYNPFNGHPAQNIDPNTGSYTINFTGK